MYKPAFFVLSLLLLASCSSKPTSSAQPDAPAVQTSPAVATNSPGAESAPATERDRLVGVWKLVAFEQMDGSGAVSLPFTDQAVGRLVLDKANRLSVFVMKPGRHASVNSTSGVALASMEDLRQIADGFLAYYGTFAVDEEAKTITTMVEAATLPAWTNSQQKRTYELADKQLILSSPATRLVWERQPD